MKGSRISKLISLALCFLMVFSLLPVSALAEASSVRAQIIPSSTLSSDEETSDTPLLDTSTPEPSSDPSDDPTPDSSSSPDTETTPTPTPAPVEFTVQFVVNGETVDTQLVVENASVIEPSFIPDTPAGEEFDGMVFLYWATADGSSYDFSSQVHSSFTLFAKFGVAPLLMSALFGFSVESTSTLNEVTITFYLGNKDDTELAVYTFYLTDAQLDSIPERGVEVLNWFQTNMDAGMLGVSGNFDNHDVYSNGQIKLDGATYFYTVTANIMEGQVPTTYTVHYLDQDTNEKLYPDLTVAAYIGDTVTEYAKTTPDGYTLNSTDPQTITLLYTGNVITFYYKAASYTITYNLNDSSIAPASNNNPVSYTANVLPLTLTNPTRPGYDFVSWSDGGVIPVGSTGNKTFSATWSAPISYSINYTNMFDAVNSSSNPDSYTIETPTFTLSNPSRVGYDFLRWDSTFSTTISQGSTGERTYAAVWSDPIEYSITYNNLLGGTNPASNLNSYTVETPTFTLADPFRVGYNFLRWDSAFSTTITQGVTTGNLEFTAVWSVPIPYSIDYTNMFDAVNPTSNLDSYTVETPTFTLADPSRVGYDFLRWDSTFSTTISQGSTGERTYAAVWSDPTEYSITYNNLLGGTNPASNLDSYTVETPTFTLADPSRVGYNFARWDSAFSTTITQGVTTGNLEFTAVWSDPIEYSITYNNLLGGTNPASNLDSYTVNTPTFTLADPSRVGYNFVRWDSAFSTTIEQGVTTGNLEFTAVWSDPIEYSITYNNLLGGTNPASNLDSYTVETPTFTLADASRVGYNFVRWDSAFSTTITQGVTTGNLEFTAVWSDPIEYSITYNMNEGINDPRNPDTYTIETPTFTLFDPSRDGYYFLGWTPSDTTIEIGSTGNLTFTANWEKKIALTLTANSATVNYDGILKSVSGFTSDDSSGTLTFGGTTTAGVHSTAPGIYEATFQNTDGLIIYSGGVDVTNQYTVTFINGSLMIRPQVTYRINVNGTVLYTEWVDYGTGSASYSGFTPPQNTTYRGSNYYWSGSFDPASASNITANTVINALYVRNKTLIIRADSAVKVYNGTEQSITTASLSDNSVTVTGYTVFGSGTNVGVYTANVTLTPDFKIMSGSTDVTYQYDVSTWKGYLTISPAFLPIVYSGYSDDYDGAAHGITVSTTVEGAKIRYSTSPHLFPSQYTLSASPTYTNADGLHLVYFVVTMDNYFPYYGVATVSINPVAIELTAQSNDFTYNGSAQTWHYYDVTSGSFVGSEGLASVSFSSLSTVTNVSDSGTWNTITGVTFLPGTLSSNYTVSYEHGILNVLPADTMEVKASSYSDIYDGAAHGVTAAANIQGTDTAITDGTVIRYSTSPHTDPADYELTESPKATHVSESMTVYFVATNPNYNPAFGSADITIEVRDVNVISDSDSKVFDNTALTATGYTIEDLAGIADGFVSGEGFATEPAPTGSIVNVGTVDNLFDLPELKANTTAGDYNITREYGTLTITPRTVTIVMDSAAKNFGDVDPTFTYSLMTGVGYYDIIDGTGITVSPMRTDISAATAEDVGVHTGVISADILAADATAEANYSITVTPADFTIDPQIVYDANTTDAVTGMPATVWFAYNTAALLSDGAGVARVGYTLTGWQDAATLTVYLLGETIPALTENITLLAVWAPIPYSVTYVAGAVGVTNMPANVAAVLYNTNYTVSGTIPLRAGFTFVNWTTTGITGVAQTYASGAAFAMPANNVVLTANWVANLSPVIYHANGGTGTDYTEDLHATLSLVTVDANSFTRTGYRFIGWSETPTGAVTQQPGNTFVMPATEVNFYAQWEQLYYTVTYIVNGGTLDGLDGTTPYASYTDIPYGATVPIPNDPSQDGYTFGGWTNVIPATMPDQDLTFYGTLTQVSLQAQIIPDQATPLAGPTWSLANLILAALTTIGIGSIIALLKKKRADRLTRANKTFRISTLLPAAGAILAFILTQNLSGAMVMVDRWTILMAGITLVQAALVALGFRSKAH